MTGITFSVTHFQSTCQNINYFNSYHANKLSQKEKIVSLINNIIPDTDIDEGVKGIAAQDKTCALKSAIMDVYDPKQR